MGSSPWEKVACTTGVIVVFVTTHETREGREKERERVIFFFSPLARLARYFKNSNERPSNTCCALWGNTYNSVV